MEQRRRTWTALLVVFTAILVASCCGPAGPPGPPGPPGPAGPGGGAVLLLTGTANISDPSITRFGMFARENQPGDREDSVLFALPRAGTLSNLYVAPSSAIETPGATVQITVRVNKADTALSLTHTQADGAANLVDTTTTVPVSAGDRISIRFQETAGLDPVVTPGTFAHYNVTLELH